MDEIEPWAYDIWDPLAQKLLMPWFNATAPKMIPYMELHHAKN